MDTGIVRLHRSDTGVPYEASVDVGEMVPPESPLEMPEQRLDAWQRRDGDQAEKGDALSIALARTFVFALTALFTLYGASEMVAVVGETKATILQGLFVFLFASTFIWIALAAANSVLGFFAIVARQVRAKRQPDTPLNARTALLVPIYNENVDRLAVTLRLMSQEIVALGQGWHFDVFVLSDTRDVGVARQEQEMAWRLRQRFYGRMGFFYRRREENTARKPGNLADFVRRWGGDYEHMIVLDADSYMTGNSMAALVRAMEADPRAGLIQTSPTLRHGKTLFARLQQFATGVYGPVVVSGLALWHGRDGNYWGHNAIIRTKAFASCCGLPELRGRKPFGGHILSHDFVEAALLRRAGWDVYMRPEIAGSYEESPPTLAEHALRDRRWAQGNIQHAKILPSKGLHWMSRFHMLNGIVSYIASPLWFGFLAVGFILAWQASLVTPVYFGDTKSLFPTWPVFDAERAFALMGYSLFILLLPKILGGAGALLDTRLRRGTGGWFLLTFSVFLEILISALVAPVMMLMQTRFVGDILMARDSGWEPQARAGEAPPLSQIIRRHWLHTAAGVLLAAAAYMVSVGLFYWLLPVSIGLCLSIPIAYATSQRSLGTLTRRLRLFLTPEERRRQLRGRSAVAKPAPALG